MQRTRVQSSELASVGYDIASRVLEVEFVAGGVYRYGGVSLEVYDALMAADSLGRYFTPTSAVTTCTPALTSDG